MSAMTPAGTTPYYYIPAPSRHPVMVAAGMLLVIFGASQWVNGTGWGAWVLLAGLVVWLACWPNGSRRRSMKVRRACTQTALTSHFDGA